MTSNGNGPRVGLFGLLGSGNIGNDASVEAIVRYLRRDQPDTVLDAMCMGPGRIRERYGIETVPVHWQAARTLPSGLIGMACKVFGRMLDVVRTAAWVRRHEVVIVPGMGIMDASLPINPWGIPFSLFLITLAGWLLQTSVGLVSVGASPARNPLTARLYAAAARLAVYRSFRDEASRTVVSRMGVSTARDPVYPDLVFSLPLSESGPTPLAVGVGVMAYYGTNEDRDRSDEIYAGYVSKHAAFVGWLLDSGRRVRLFTGDESDQAAVDAIMAAVRQSRPDLDPAWLTGDPVTTFAELTHAIGSVSTVVATRFHNVVFALKLGKPTISLGYSPKNDSLMSDFGLAEYTQHAQSLDVELLKSQFTAVEEHADEVRALLRERLPKQAAQARAQLDELTEVLFRGQGAKGWLDADGQRVQPVI